MSLTATNSMSEPRLRAARKKLRPILPNPFTPTRTLIRPPCRPSGVRFYPCRLANLGFCPCREQAAGVRLALSGSVLVGCRIQTPSGITVRSAVQTEGEVVLGASPPARSLRCERLRARPTYLDSCPTVRRRGEKTHRHRSASFCNFVSRRCAAAFVAGGRSRRASSRSDRVGFRTRRSATSRNSGGRCPSRPAASSRLRSEEHTSELQSRETISYAVFCLKK